LYNLILHLFRLFSPRPNGREPNACKNIKIEGKTQIKLIYFHIIKRGAGTSDAKSVIIVIIMSNVGNMMAGIRRKERSENINLRMMKFWVLLCDLPVCFLGKVEVVGQFWSTLVVAR
jgi:hypothetical protein